MSIIVQSGNAVLRKISEPVPQDLFGTPELAGILRDMETTLDGALDGVALAAPQIAIPYRIFIVRYDRTISSDEKAEQKPDVGIYINPSFVRTAKRRVDMDEGCLSVHGIYGKTHRHDRATVRAQDEHGNWFERGAGGLLAQIFQHEIDHLQGILFIDHATDITEVRRKESDDTHDSI